MTGGLGRKQHLCGINHIARASFKTQIPIEMVGRTKPASSETREWEWGGFEVRRKTPANLGQPQQHVRNGGKD